MEFNHDKVEYIITDGHSKNDGIMLGYLQMGLDNLIKDILHNQIVKIQVVRLEDMDKTVISDIDEIRAQQGAFDWDYGHTYSPDSGKRYKYNADCYYRICSNSNSRQAGQNKYTF